MIYMTQLIYINEGMEDIFDQFEQVAIPAILRYSGKLLLRVRPAKKAFLEANIEEPYEIHFVEFDSEQDFKNFSQDEERKVFLYLKEQSIRSSLLFQGIQL